MSPVVETSCIDDIAVVLINNPPVNALGHAVRTGLQAALTALIADEAVEAIVLGCRGRTFAAGADIREFGQPLREPVLRDIIVTLESSSKPTVAAIHGTALGGGLELALACNHRVGLRTAQAGLPEVRLGILPGAGGTVRLPYLIGADHALPMIVTGMPVDAERAHSLGLFDAVVDEDIIAGAVDFARRVAAAGHQPRRIRDRPRPVAGPGFEAAVAELTRKARGQEAPLACIAAVRNAIELTFDAAMARERELIVRLAASDQAKALRHRFFAERAAAKVAGVDKNTARRRITKVGMVGAGTMGGGIAMAFADGGFPVVLHEPQSAPLDRGMARIASGYDDSVRRGRMTVAERGERLARLTPTTDPAALTDCNLIVEAVVEDLAVKKDVFAQLDRIVEPGAVLATNTSYLDVDAIAASTRRPEDVLGLHFFSPANVMKLVEVVRGSRTSPEVLATALHVVRSIGKVGVVVGLGHGFAGNRMLSVRNAEVEQVLLEGADPVQIDQVYRDFGWAMGPLQAADLAGLDISWRNRKAQGITAAVADALCEMGRLGQKTGMGYYRYEGRKAIPDPAVTALIAAKSAELGVGRRVIDAVEIIERTMYPLVNEGARILADGLVARAGDIDVIWINGYGFPPYRGGPMFWAQAEGLDKIVAGLTRWHRARGSDHFVPAPLLSAAAEQGHW